VLPLQLPELQTITNDIDLIKIKQTENTTKKQVSASPNEAKTLKVDVFSFMNAKAWNYL